MDSTQNSSLKTHHSKLFYGIYSGRKVLITGHTGFKGSWLAYWLLKMGASVCGYSLNPPTNPSHFDLLKLEMESHVGDIRDSKRLLAVLASFKPEIVFHLAAQPLVRLSYREPRETFETNVMGTLNVLEACRQTDSVKAIVNITSDKCYENREWVWGYRENDPMGGFDPYSASKGCAELVASCYRNSYFNLEKYDKQHAVLLASCRAGNVIGGGDWALDRLVPDIMKAVSKGETVIIRNPAATRPWQHVLEPLSGYLLVGQRLLEGKKEFAEAWNFGPSDNSSISVEEVVKAIQKYWPRINYKIEQDKTAAHEANLLKLDCSKAHIKLGWKETWNSIEAFEKTTNWYRNYYESGNLSTEDDINRFVNCGG
ncbi:MAG TPA: CDP-glucose 4,6-dehydratase [Lentisphaeria bacterium]|nr:MAG: CDP-glucose 4,6-dehydratase [Lentisphaerae bacterium GWF2_38_69]HBM16430.1 CDP-glucose 4,6-dehydratase [Lentisphaeria bacterium]